LARQPIDLTQALFYSSLGNVAGKYPELAPIIASSDTLGIRQMAASMVADSASGTTVTHSGDIAAWQKSLGAANPLTPEGAREISHVTTNYLAGLVADEIKLSSKQPSSLEEKAEFAEGKTLLQQLRSKFFGAGKETRKQEEETFVYVEALKEHVPASGLADSSLNPGVRLEDAKYFMVVIADASIEKNERTGELELNKFPNNGHIYNKFIDASGPDIKESFYGLNPKKEGRPISKGVIKDEKKRADDAEKYQGDVGIKVKIQKIVPLTKEQFENSEASAKARQAKPGTYVGHFDDCIEFTQNLLKAAGVKAKVTDLVDASTLDVFTLARVSASLRYGDYKEVIGNSREEVAKEYNIDINRVKRNPYIRQYNSYIILPLSTSNP